MKNTLKTDVQKGVLLAGMVLSLASCALPRGGVTDGFLMDSRDGQRYKTVKIGSQTWMAENLNYKAAKSFCFENNLNACDLFGRLYTWEAARKACPDGWHLPSKDEWNALETFVADSLFGGKTDSVGYALKSASGWEEYEGKSGNGSDAFGFGALPAGSLFGDGTFDFVLGSTFFWEASEYGANEAYSRNLIYYGTKMIPFGFYKGGALSVRCVKDDSAKPLSKVPLTKKTNRNIRRQHK